MAFSWTIGLLWLVIIGLISAAIPSSADDPECLPVSSLALAAVGGQFNILFALISLAVQVDPPFYSGLLDPYAEFTLLAPTDAAFLNFFDEYGISIEDIVFADRRITDAILKYHVLPKAMAAEDFEFGESSVTASLAQEYFARVLPDYAIEDVRTDITVELPYFKGIGTTATVITADQKACSAIVHVVDNMLSPFTEEQLTYILDGGYLPEWTDYDEFVYNATLPDLSYESLNGCSNVAEVAAASGQFSILLALADIASRFDPEFYAALRDPSAEFTLFAPTDEAFIKTLLINYGLSTEAIFNADPKIIDAVLKYHILPTPIMSADFEYNKSYNTSSLAQEYFAAVLPTLCNTLTTADDFTNVTVALPYVEAIGSSATVISADIIACSAVIHVMDNMLSPFRVRQLEYIIDGGILPDWSG